MAWNPERFNADNLQDDTRNFCTQPFGEKYGGIGSIPGAFIGGILLGVIEILSKAYISSQMSDAIVFSVLIIVLLVKPTGILGKKINEKV